MSPYDFRVLNDKEFEILCADLIGALEGTRFERFKAGRDGGIDARCFEAPDKQIVLQCKHWVNTSLEKLVARLKTHERPKVDKLRPARYILAVSHPLSATDKAKIARVFHPFLRTPSDVYGREDLNDLLARFPIVETKHYKLWITSSNVLRHLLNQPAYDRAALLLSEGAAFSRKYIATSSHDAALDRLDKMRVVLITGEAGIGKTTLAQQLCVHYAALGYELVHIADDIREAESVFAADRSQLFYFDDFLGRNYMEALTGHEGNRIVQFIRRVAAAPDKRLVLTSRSTILNQGKTFIDNFAHAKTDRNELELTIKNLTEADKARILYSHMWHSTLSPEFKDEIYEDRRYRLIVHHPNYNPRLIDFITDSDRLEECAPSDYWPYIEAALDDPKDVWHNPFDAQQDDFGRGLVLLVTLNARLFDETDLSEAYERYCRSDAGPPLTGRSDFLTNMRQLVGSLLTRTISPSSGVSHVDLFNPALGDYVLRRYSRDTPSLRRGFLALRSTSSAQTLKSLYDDELVSRAAYMGTVRAILTAAAKNEFVGYTSEYIATVATQLIDGIQVDPEISPLLAASVRFVASEALPAYFAEVLRLLRWGAASNLLSQDEIWSFLQASCETRCTREELREIAQLIETGLQDAGSKSEARRQLQAAMVAYLSDNLESELQFEDVFDGVDEDTLHIARENAESILRRTSESLGVMLDSPEIDELVDSYDVADRLAEAHRAERIQDRNPRAGSAITGPDEIDDIFERT